MTWIRTSALLAIAAVVAGGLGAPGPPQTTRMPTVRILLGGDVMLGRGVADVVASRPESVFAGIRLQMKSADLALANLESPLTWRPYRGLSGNDLRADPAAAALVAAAGFDAVSVANNHAGDGGLLTVSDTVRALRKVRVAAVGGGIDADEAWKPSIIHAGDISVGVLAFDASGGGPAATAATPGVAVWDASRALGVVDDLRRRVDVLIVSVHGGAEYLLTPDARMRKIAGMLAAHGVDVVWGHGAHVVQPVDVLDPDHDGRFTVAAPSLGNLVFDQRLPGTDRGGLLEVLAGPRGPVAFRLGSTEIHGGTVEFSGWELPQGPAVMLGGAWWSLPSEPMIVRAPPTTIAGFAAGDLVAAATGDLDGDGDEELVTSFRRPWRQTALGRLLPGVQWQDTTGRSAHIGVYESKTLKPQWIASAMVRPVAELAVCDGAVAVRYATLDDPEIKGIGAWTWNGFGWDEAADLEGLRLVGCRDIDGDRATDPVAGTPADLDIRP